MRMKRAILALIALLLPGCGASKPDLGELRNGRIPLDGVELQALETLFHDAPDVTLQTDRAAWDADLSQHGVLVLDGHVVALKTRDLDAGEPLSAFSELEDLTLRRSSIPRLEGLGPWPKLRRLRMPFSDLESLAGMATCCPQLATLHLSHGTAADLAPLDGLPLVHLDLDHIGLESLHSAPSLPHLTSLHLTSIPLASLAGLERFSNLESLQLFGLKALRDLDLPPLPRLRQLRLFQNGLIALTNLPELPSLEEIEASDNRILSLHLDELPALRQLAVHEKDLLRVELGELPALQTVDLRGEGSLFKDGGQLAELNIASQPQLEKLDLGSNHIQHLNGLAPQPKLWQAVLDRNPFAHLDHFVDGFPQLRHVSVRRTRVHDIPEALNRANVVVSHDPGEIEANMWENVLRQGFETMRDTFVETLPASGGRLEGYKARCSLRTATFSTPRLACTISIREASGLIPLELLEVDPLSPASGGPNIFRVRATIRTERGRARIYLKYRLDIRRHAEALASYRDRERPWFSIGESSDPEDLKDGFVFAEATPGQPGTVQGEAHILVDRLVVWVEGKDAEGVELVLE